LNAGGRKINCLSYKQLIFLNVLAISKSRIFAIASIETDLGSDPDGFFAICYLLSAGVNIRVLK